MKKIRILSALCIFCFEAFSALQAQQVMYVQVYDKNRKKAEVNAGEGYMEVFSGVHQSQQKALNYKRRMLIDNVFVTEFQREALNADMHISQEVITLMEKGVQKLRSRIDEIWQYYDKEFRDNPTMGPIIKPYYEAKKKQMFEDVALVDRKVDAFIKGKGVDNTIASPRQRMEIIRELRKDYQQLCGLSSKQASIFRAIVIGKLTQDTDKEKGAYP